MTGIATAVTLGAVYAAADELLAQRGHSFHWARRLLSARHAERATRLYGFCRRIDDVADEATDAAAAHAELSVIRRALQTGECDDNNTAETADMLQLMRACSIDPAVPLELIRGVEGDLGEVRVADMEELLRYCYRVAGTVGLMMTAALDVTAPQALPHAIDLGIAMQLTNICRDVHEDAVMGRRYLPATLVGPLEPVALVDPTTAVRATVTHALRVLLEAADRHYASGEQGLRYLPASASTGILVAARVYRGIGTVLRKREFDCWSSRAKVGTAGKLAITLRALAATATPAVLRPSDAARLPFASSQGVLPRHPAAAWAAEWAKETSVGD
jgi:15-cis-phytoene synthase